MCRLPGMKLFAFCVFTELVLHSTSGASGGHISVLTEIWKRATKGLQSRPLETCFDTGERRGDVRRSYEFAQMQLTQLSRLRRSAYPLTSACCGANFTVLPTIFLGTAVSMSPVEAVLAIALAIAKRRQTPTARHRTGLNRINCTPANS